MARGCGFLIAMLVFVAQISSTAEAESPPGPLLAKEGAPPGGVSFLITFWCGPPLEELDDALAEEIAAAGFTVIGPPCEYIPTATQNLRALDVAARHGLTMWIRDIRFEAYHPPKIGWRLRVARAVEQYGDHPALSGYYLVDEPDATRFADLAALVHRLRVLAPRKLAYVNLYPRYIDPEHLGTKSYEEYVERFLTVVQPELLSFDHYPFLEGKDRTDFFTNLWIIREAARRHDVPFLFILQAMPHLSYRDPTEAELAWQAFHALAFGARGISYFTYWTPLDVRHQNKANFRYGLIENGKPTLHYFQAARINRTVAALAGELAGYQSWGVLDSRAGIASGFPYGPIERIEGGPVTAGVFVGPRAELAFLLVNRDYQFGVEADLRLQPDAAGPMVFDTATGRWNRVDGTIALEPGGARLVRFER